MPQFIATAGRLMMAWWILEQRHITGSNTAKTSSRTDEATLENFWDFAKAKLSQFHGIKREFFLFTLKGNRISI